MTSAPAWVLWAAFVATAAGTYLVRISFVMLFRRFDDVPARVERALELVPAAVLAALVVPSFLAPDGAVDVVSPQLAAGIVAAAVAWRTRSMSWTLAVGMVTLWLLLAV